MIAEAQESYVAERFDALRERFPLAVAPSEEARWSALARALGDVRGALALDLGCGRGRSSRFLMGLGAEVVGLDRSPGMLQGAVGLPRVLGSARALPFATGAFDVATMVEVLQHLPDVEGALDESSRVLRPGGTIAIVDRNAWAMDADRPWAPAVFVKWLDTYRGRWMYPHGGPVRERWPRPGRLRALMRRRFDAVADGPIAGPPGLWLWTGRAR